MSEIMSFGPNNPDAKTDTERMAQTAIQTTINIVEESNQKYAQEQLNKNSSPQINDKKESVVIPYV